MKYDNNNDGKKTNETDRFKTRFRYRHANHVPCRTRCPHLIAAHFVAGVESGRFVQVGLSGRRIQTSSVAVS